MKLRIVKSVSAMQKAALEWKVNGVKIALVPTMGALHEGHLSLVHRARKAVGNGGRVVVSIYVNPTQFAPHEDFKRYPRPFRADVEACRQAGVDLVFAPNSAGMYPGSGDSASSTAVLEESLSKVFEGQSRPGFFRGVTTVVAKLFLIVLPDVAVFGAKDLQQSVVIKRMVRDLHFPVKIIVLPTVREKDGLAMSSRNRYLSETQRQSARVLFEAIRRARAMVGQSPRKWTSVALKKQLIPLFERADDCQLDYLEVVDATTLHPVERVGKGNRILIAARVGTTRLIDNGLL